MPEESHKKALHGMFLEKQILDELSNPLWNLQFVQAYKSRKEFGVNGEGVTVAVIDSGIDDRHPDLRGKVIDAFNIEKDGKTDLEDRLGHGTKVAGIIAGDKTGVAPAVSIISIKVGDNERYAPSYIRSGLELCENFKPDVINISSGFSIYLDDVKEFCDLLIKNGTIIVAAAGNNHTGAFFPASYNSVISAVAVKNQEEAYEHCRFSNIWPTADISAPGNEILSTYPLKGYKEGKSVIRRFIGKVKRRSELQSYRRISGTSAAAPHISGVLALGISLLKRKQKKDYAPNYELARLLTETLKETTIKVSEEEPYRKNAFELLRTYQNYYDEKKVFLKDSEEAVRALYGIGYVRAYDFLKKLNEKT